MSEGDLEALTGPVVAALATRRPVFARLFREGDRDLAAYVRGFAEDPPAPLQDRQDYVDQVAAEVAAAQGEAVAARVRARLQASPVVNTANHLSLECLPLTVQSMLVAALGEGPEGILPVEAAAGIPADNVSFPTGLLLARRREGRMLRIPILDLSRKARRQVAGLLDPFGPADLDRAEGEIAELCRAGTCTPIERDAVLRVVGEVLRAPEVLGQPTFRAQAAAATPRLWQAWFAPEARVSMPALAYSAYESVRVPLLRNDLQETGTLVNRILFDPRLRTEVLARLDGIPGCWTAGGREGGSAFFWALGPERRAYAMALEGESLRAESGRKVPLEPEALAEGLAEATLMPTIFLTLMLGLARGLVQVGGFSQIDYLEAMRRGLAGALEAAGYGDWSRRLGGGLRPFLTAGLAAVAVDYGTEVQAAGGLELVAHGGLGLEDLARLRRLSLREALLLELPSVARIVLGDQGASGAPIPAVRDLVRSLGDRIPVIRL